MLVEKTLVKKTSPIARQKKLSVELLEFKKMRVGNFAKKCI